MTSTSIYSPLLPSLSPVGKISPMKTLTTIPTLLRVEFQITTCQETTHISCVHRRYTLTEGWRMCILRMQWRRHCKDTKRNLWVKRGRGTDIGRINRRHTKMTCSTYKTRKRKSGEIGKTPTSSSRSRWRSAKHAKNKKPKS